MGCLIFKVLKLCPESGLLHVFLCWSRITIKLSKPKNVKGDNRRNSSCVVFPTEVKP